jgi:hypothetical protein
MSSVVIEEEEYFSIVWSKSKMSNSELLNRPIETV